MTYMFEYPQYVRVALDDDIENKYPRFGLYAYGEGFVTEKLRRMHFTGIPVLFVPGNAGSHEQVRSIASVSLRKSLKDRTPFHFDFFTVSLGKDHSALYGGRNYSKRSSLISTKCKCQYEKKASQIKDAGITMVSIGGGPRDIIVPANQVIDPIADINILSTSIPNVWKSTDHLCILWCKQLVLSIVRFLFDSVNHIQKPHKIYDEPARKLEALSYHFLHQTSGKKLYRYKEKVNFNKHGRWIENIQRQYTWESKVNNSEKETTYLMIRLTKPRDHITIETINLEAKDWLFACSASNVQGFSRVCDWGWNLTNKTRMAPDYSHRLRRVVDLNTQEIKYPDVTHVIVRITSEDMEKNVIVNIDAYPYENRIVPIKGRTWHITNLFSSDSSSLLNFGSGQTRYYVSLDKMNVINVELKNIECTDVKGPIHTGIELLEPWSPGTTQTIFLSETDNGPKTIKVQTRYDHSMNTSVTLRMTLEPKCSYIFNIQKGGIIDQISYNGTDIFPTVTVTLALCIYFDLVFESFVALAIIYVFAIGTCCSVIFLGSLAHGIAVRFLARAIAFSITWADWLLGGLNQLPFFTTILVISLVPATCGALSMVISVFLYFLKLTRMYEDYLEELLMSCLQHFNFGRFFRNRVREESRETSENTQQKILNHLLIFILWSFTAISAIPSVLVWAKNFSYNTRLLTEDSILLVCWEVLAVCGTLELVQISSKSSNSWILSNMLRFLSWVILSMAAATRPSFYQWYIPPFVALVVTVLSFHSIIIERLNL
ncbi:hypothetical protein KPH14_001783 [Odynerus spinipes]|uniref:GPI inositol-deacylase PGAP1-like alpha/beta domain-containing protein n=1 Tax=Odynerus spinipes TaxID=1348599 RepID=A0AAD9S0D5_9HYME|nr:hypothetical protein KPH14_001783 [Odynerus spinipes]